MPQSERPSYATAIDIKERDARALAADPTVVGNA
jgi:hypothetical protein